MRLKEKLSPYAGAFLFFYSSLNGEICYLAGIGNVNFHSGIPNVLGLGGCLWLERSRSIPAQASSKEDNNGCESALNPYGNLIRANYHQEGGCMPTIRVLIFRGTGGVTKQDHPAYGEPGLVRAGHVGVMGVIEGKIIGFHPTPEAAAALGGEAALLKALIEHQAQPGCLQDDDLYFERAYQLAAEAGERTTVYTYEVDIADETLEAIQSWYNERKEVPYNFPYADGHFEPGHSNCATFWALHFGIALPEYTGRIERLIDLMKADKEYDIWQPKN